MTIKIITAAALAALLLAGPRPARAAEEGAKPADPAGASEPATKEEVKALAEELRRLKLELGLKDVEYASYSGLGPAASKVYFAQKGLSIGGYAEATYENTLDQETGDVADVLRVVAYLGYRFSDRIVFNSEIEFEHGGEEIGVEFAYVDLLLSPAANLRIGNVLVPVGIVNQMHEPAFFNGVFRPDLERNVIPATWHDNGLGLHGELSGLKYEAYLLAGPRLAGTTLSPGSWIRAARSGAGEAPAQTFAGALALRYAVGPVSLGLSGYLGQGGQGERNGAGEEIDSKVSLVEGHALLAWRGLQGKVLLARGTLSGTEDLAVSGSSPLGTEVRGGYVEAGYDVLSLLDQGGAHSLVPFVRVERYDLNADVASGQTADPALDQTVVTAGLTYKPVPVVVLKADYQQRSNEAAGAEDAKQVNLGIGVVF